MICICLFVCLLFVKFQNIPWLYLHRMWIHQEWTWCIIETHILSLSKASHCKNKFYVFNIKILPLKYCFWYFIELTWAQNLMTWAYNTAFLLKLKHSNLCPRRINSFKWKQNYPINKYIYIFTNNYIIEKMRNY